ncbi:MAG TPA: hypothetical protein VGG46_08945 [Terriglobales bacterium]|jgi:hypothetical protein
MKSTAEKLETVFAPKSSRAEYMQKYRSTKRASETEASKLAASIKKSFDDAKKRIEAALLEVPAGTQVHLRHIEALAKLERSYRDELSERGLSPQNLGVATAQGWKFVCSVNARGSVAIVEVKRGQADPQSAPFPERSGADLKTINELESEFGDAPRAETED